VFDPALGVRIVLAPKPDKLVKMVGAQDGPVPGEVVEVVHDDSHKEVEDEEGADDEEGDEVDESEVGAATGGVVGVLRSLVANDVWSLDTAQHDLLPGLSRGRPEQDQEGLGEGLEVVVPVDVGPLLRRNLAEHLHADDAVDEEDESYEDGYPGQGLEGFDEGPEEGPDALALAQQLDQPHHTEQTEEVDGNHVATRV